MWKYEIIIMNNDNNVILILIMKSNEMKIIMKIMK